MSRVFSGKVSYRSHPVTTVTDLTQFSTVFGRFDETHPASPFPGPSSSEPYITSIPSDGYLALEFVCPHATVNGILTYPRRGGGINGLPVASGIPIDVSISATEGDFGPNATHPHAVHLNVPAQEERAMGYGTRPNVEAPLTPGQTYFLNIRAHTPPAGLWSFAMINNHG